MNTFRPMLSALAALALIVPAVVPVQAQGPPPGGQIPPQVRARMQQWSKWRDTHKNIAALQQTLGGFEQMEKDKKTQLTKAQAKIVVGVLKAWRNKPVMTDAQARTVNKQLTDKLTVAQLKKIATARERRERRPGGQGGPGMGGARPGGGGARPGGPGGPGGAGGQRFDPSRFPAPREFNPLNPASIPMERQRTRAKQRLDALTKTLTARAK